MRAIKLRLTPESADEAIREVEAYRDEVVQIVRELGETLVKNGVEYAKAKIMAYDAVETGELLGSIDGFFDPVTGRGFIKTTNNHAAFVEFGTGIVGATNRSHEPKPFEWQHDSHNHGDYGWVYGKDYRRWTKGMPPRPFMWDTWQMMCEDASEMMRSKFNG